MKIILFCILSVCCIIQVPYAQPSEIDSLEKVLKTLPKGQEKVCIMTQLSYAYSYARTDLKKAQNYAEKALKMARELHFAFGIGEAYSKIGSIYMYQGKYPQSKKYLYKALSIFQKTDSLNSIGTVYNNLGILSNRQEKLLIAYQYYLKALAIYKKTNKKRQMGHVYNNLGGIARIQKKYKKALNFQQKALFYYKYVKDSMRAAIPLGNIGLMYFEQGKYTEALDYYHRGLKLAKKFDNKLMESPCLTGIGKIYLIQKNYFLAKQYLSWALKKAASLYHKSDIHFELGKLYLAKKKYVLAETNLHKVIKVRKETGIESCRSFNLLSIVYKTKGDYKKSLEYYQRYISIRDSMLNQTEKVQLQEMELQYETAQKEKENQQLRYEKKLQTQQQVAWMWGGGIVLCLMIILVGYFYYHHQQKKRKNQLLRIQNNAITQQSYEIIAQRDYISQQNEELTIYHKSIEDSLYVAKNIQKSMLPTASQFSERFDEHFILYKPKDIVSGDFYWLSTLKQSTYLAVVDCTGHGVPGAFMSMTGHQALYEIICRQGITDLGQVIQQLHQSIMDTFNNRTAAHIIGMDIGLCCFSPQDSATQVTYAGTKRPLYYVEKGLLKEIKGTRVTVGEAENLMSPVATHSLNLSQGTVLYLSTDGFIDTPNPKRERFGTLRLKKLLKEIHHLPLNRQEAILENTLKIYKQHTPQRDDVTVIGVKV